MFHFFSRIIQKHTLKGTEFWLFLLKISIITQLLRMKSVTYLTKYCCSEIKSIRVTVLLKNMKMHAAFLKGYNCLNSDCISVFPIPYLDFSLKKKKHVIYGQFGA